jgi:hypothetical protein
MIAFFKRRIVRIGLLVAALALLLALANPQAVPSVLLIVPFVLLFFVIFLSVLQVVGFLRSHDDDKIAGFSLRRPWVVAALVAGIPVLMLILQSIGQLTVRDVVTILVLFSVAYFYIARSSVSLFH